MQHFHGGWWEVCPGRTKKECSLVSCNGDGSFAQGTEMDVVTSLFLKVGLQDRGRVLQEADDVSLKLVTDPTELHDVFGLLVEPELGEL